uniref:B-cell receptor CD22 n=1 Tax=Centroberyx gerrardi TaxID=166262 RepID=UPI003AB0BD52
MSFMAALHVNTVMLNMLLCVFFLSGALADCDTSALSITTPGRMEALSGSCLQIPCSFRAKNEEEFNSSRPAVGVWIKNDPRFGQFPNNVIFHSGRANNIYPVDIIGNLTQKNCTTIFSSLNTSFTDSYFFRIENSPFLATDICRPLGITVKDSPPRPRIKISGEQREGELVNITCSAVAPCPRSPPTLRWNLPWDAENQTEENADRTITATLQVNVTLSDEHDGLKLTCSASYPVNEGKDTKAAEETVTFNVSYSPKNTLARVSPSAGPLSLGSWVNLTCSSRARPPVSRFTWFKSSKDGSMKVSQGDFYSFNVSSVDDGGVYYCVATNDLGNQTSEIHLTIQGPPGPLGSGPLEVILGVISGIILLICLVVFIWWLKSRHTALMTQNQLGEEPASEAEEEIHYGEIDFSKLEPKRFSDAVQVGEQQDTEYAEVKVSQPAETPTQIADVPEDIYAQVKKH